MCVVLLSKASQHTVHTRLFLVFERQVGMLPFHLPTTEDSSPEPVMPLSPLSLPVPKSKEDAAQERSPQRSFLRCDI